MNVWGRATTDIENIGQRPLGRWTTCWSQPPPVQGRVVVPDTRPEKGCFYRADHFEFAKGGVPAIYTSAGKEVIGELAGFGQQKFDEYVAQHYHQPSDDVDPTWNFAGAMEDTAMLFEIGYRLAVGEDYPQWHEGAEFKPKRDAMFADTPPAA